MKLPALGRVFPVAFALGMLLNQTAEAADVQIVHPLVDVCSLVSTQTASAILGSPASAQSSDPASHCAWTSVTGSGGEVEAILIFVDWPGPSEVTRLAQNSTFGIPSRTAHRVNDLPATAVWLQPENPQYADRALVVLYGGMVMSIYVAADQSDAADTESREYSAALRVAKEALMNLP
jgi:hypothetical protein